jgi:hypothetical protein
LFYTTRSSSRLASIDEETLELQDQLWSTVRPIAQVQPSCVMALAVSGMNDVLNSRGYTQAAWWNRIPDAAWALMGTIAIWCNVLIGYGSRRTHDSIGLILPIAVSISFFLISDIDSPRGGAVRIMPQNLESLSHSLGRE